MILIFIIAQLACVHRIIFLYVRRVKARSGFGLKKKASLQRAVNVALKQVSLLFRCINADIVVHNLRVSNNQLGFDYVDAEGYPRHKVEAPTVRMRN